MPSSIYFGVLYKCTGQLKMIPFSLITIAYRNDFLEQKSQKKFGTCVTLNIVSADFIMAEEVASKWKQYRHATQQQRHFKVSPQCSQTQCFLEVRIPEKKINDCSVYLHHIRVVNWRGGRLKFCYGTGMSYFSSLEKNFVKTIRFTQACNIR